MILGTEARVRPTTPSDPWQPVSSSVAASEDSDAETHVETYVVASESM